MKKFRIFFILILGMALITFQYCSSDDGTVSCFPNSTIDTQINLNLPQYQALNTPNGFVVTSGAAGEGTRGLIIVRTSSGFKVYDRNAPHLCPDNDTTLDVKDSFIIICKKDGANWNLLTGEPLNGKSSISPKTYFSQYISSTNTLLIRNI